MLKLEKDSTGKEYCRWFSLVKLVATLNISKQNPAVSFFKDIHVFSGMKDCVKMRNLIM